MSAPLIPAAGDRTQLENIQQQLVRAWVTRDRALLEQLLAPEWMVTRADGRMSTRDEVLREFDTGDNRLLGGHVDDIMVRTFDDFAIVTGRTRARGEYKGQAYDVTLRFTDAFVRRDGKWQAVASHATRIASGDSGGGKSNASK
jgi:ketosteroid isomerase-like protein